MSDSAATSVIISEYPPAPHVRLLILDQSRDDIELLLCELRHAGHNIEHKVAETREQFRKRLLHETFDAVLSDYHLPFWTGLDAFDEMQQLGVEIPFLLITGALGEEAVAECIKRGINDYVPKDRLSRLPVVLERALQEKTLRDENARSAAALRSSEAGFRLLFADNPLPMWLYDCETLEFLQVNDAAVEHYGYSREEFLSMKLTDIRPAEEVPRLIKWIAEHPGPTRRTGPWRHRRKNGQLIDVEVSQHRLPFAGRDAALVVIGDITENVRAAERLAASESRLRAIIDAEPQCVKIVGPDGTLLEMNSAGLRMIEAGDPGQVIGKCAYSLVSPAHRERFRALIERVCRGESGVLEFEIQGLKGANRWLEMHAVPFRAEGDQIVAALSVTVDITERKHAERALRESEARAREQFAELDLLYRTAPIGFAIFDSEFRFVRINDLLATANGSSAADYIGHSIREALPELADQIEGVLRRVFENCEFVSNIEIRGEAPSQPGVERYWLTSFYPLRNRDGAVFAAGAVVLDITERKRAVEALLASEARNRELVENTTYAIFRATADGHFLDLNPALVSMLGFEAAAELLSIDLVQDIFRYPEQYALFLDSCRGKGRVSGFEAEWRRKDGANITVRLSGRLAETQKSLEVLEVIAEDVTELRAVEKQLRQAQKFEAIGQLAGGVAHDFNNVVGAILGWAEIGLEQSRANPRLFEYFAKTRQQAERAAALTRQLLAFARQQVLQPCAVDLNSVVRGLAGFLEAVIGRDVELKVTTAPSVELIRADPTQIEQVLMNLCLNARDAMPEGGRLLIETELVEIDDAYSRYCLYAQPGRYAVLNVSDTGIGMDAATRERIFEPFFTTKKVGKGTGLGLATVYGIVKQHGGFVQVYSEPGHGSLFRVYLPVLTERMVHAEGKMPSLAAAPVPQGTETILLAEDHDGVREMAWQVLSNLGYRVLTATNGEEALRVCESEKPALAILDVIMPRLNGPAAYSRLQARFPTLPVIFTTGYTAEQVSLEKHIQDGGMVLQKPYSPTMLGRIVRQVLDRTTLASNRVAE